MGDGVRAALASALTCSLVVLFVAAAPPPPVAVGAGANHDHDRPVGDWLQFASAFDAAGWEMVEDLKDGAEDEEAMAELEEELTKAGGGGGALWSLWEGIVTSSWAKPPRNR